MIVQKDDLDRSDPLWDETPSMGNEGLIATVKDNESLIRILSIMLRQQRKALSC